MALFLAKAGGGAYSDAGATLEPLASETATGTSADHVEHHDGAGPRAPALPSPVATFGLGALTIGALGVVFGDLGTSPLYTIQTVFAADNGRIPGTREAVYGVVSMVLWSLFVVVTIKYVGLVMRADNDGEGGMMALVALVRRLKDRIGIPAFGLLIALGIFGASLFFGDAMVTPAISVLSAVEGLKVVSPSFEDAVIPIALVVLLALFAVQRFGTGTVGRFFGPVMVIWFTAIALIGAVEIAKGPGILAALSPTYALAFTFNHPTLVPVALTGVVLCITGVEALYADMGHFGRRAISQAWLFVAFPALLLNYMGQGARVLSDPAARANPFFLSVPGFARVPMVLLATVATVIASQAVIAGAFSLGRSAAQLGYLPRLTVRHTSSVEYGQVYLPAINAFVAVAVVLLILGFRSAENLAAAYGVAVTGTILITTVLFFVVARARWRVPVWLAVAGGMFFGGIDLLFFGSNLTKLLAGGWFPVAVGVGAFCVFTTWNRGRAIVSDVREDEEGPLQEFIDALHTGDPSVRRVSGTAVFMTASSSSTPWALKANVEHNHVLHEQVLIVSVDVRNTPSVLERERVTLDDLGYADDGIWHITVHYGFDESPDVPAALALCTPGDLKQPIDLDEASYFVSRTALRRGGDQLQRRMPRWREALFLTLARHAANPVEYFNLPIERTVVMGGQIVV